jgi:membrane-bound lytic murein transglycosylase MltF
MRIRWLRSGAFVVSCSVCVGLSTLVAVLLPSCSPAASEPQQAAAAPATIEGEPPPSGRGEEPEVESPPADPQTEERRQVANKPWTGDLDGMLERRVIRVLVVPSKTRYFVEEGRQRGVVYEAFKELEDEINRKRGAGHVKVFVFFIPTSNDELIPGLLEGRGDIAASSLTITAGRQEQVDFSAPSLTGVSEIAVTGPRSPMLTSLDDLAGKEVFVRRSSSFWEHLEALNRRFVQEGKEPVILKAAPDELGNEDLLEMLNAGLFGITIVDDYLGELWAQVLPDIELHPEVAISTGGEIAWMIRKDSPLLKAELDGFVKTHGKGTAFGNTVLKRYLGSTQFVKDAASEAEAEKFRSLIELFQKYSGEYDMDYLLMMAQGYQESRLDHSARSHVGAIGVMQIMPATGADLKVGDITELEPNIHGGVKYMRWMIEHYYKDEPMTELDKALFAFASYNAGPGRLRQLRREAEARGLDPNVWFNNVELVAADKIGSETVTYVSNIFKYAVAYKLLSEEAEKRRAARDTVAPSESGRQP